MVSEPHVGRVALMSGEDREGRQEVRGKVTAFSDSNVRPIIIRTSKSAEASIFVQAGWVPHKNGVVRRTSRIRDNGSDVCETCRFSSVIITRSSP